MGAIEEEIHTPSSTPVEGWRMALLLLAFATVTFILEKTLHMLEHLVKSKRGLAIALEHIKNELLCVGSISLLLSAFQNLLAQICIPLSEPSVYTDRRRQLLAGGGATYCQPNGQSLWPVSLQHNTHIFIFVVACTHIVYGTFTVYLTIWRVKSWRKWEEEAQAQARANGGDMKVMKMPAKFLYLNVGSHPVIHFFLTLIRQYGTAANQTLYNNARLLFIEKNLQADLSYEFNFHDVVIKGLETELMHTLHPEWHLWMIAVIWYAIPPPAYVSYWMYGISVIIIVLVGGKLVDILVQISVQVAVKYGDSVMYGRMATNPRESRELQVLGRSSLRAPLTTSQAIQRRFLDGLNGLLPGGGWGGGGGGDAAAAGVRLPVTSNDGAGPEAAAAAGHAANGDAPISGWSSYIPKLPSRELVLQMLRSMASELSGGGSGGSAGGGGGGGGSSTGGGGGATAPQAPPSLLASGRVDEASAPAVREPESVPESYMQPSSHQPAAQAELAAEATAAEAAAAESDVEPPVAIVAMEGTPPQPLVPLAPLAPAPAAGGGKATADGHWRGGEGQPRPMSLSRGSAPATVRRPLTMRQLVLLQGGVGGGARGGGSGGGGSSSGGGGVPSSSSAAAAAPATLEPAATLRGGGGGPKGVRSHLSVIAESRPPSFLSFKGHHRQHSGRAIHHHHHHRRTVSHHVTDQHGTRGRRSTEAQDGKYDKGVVTAGQQHGGHAGGAAASSSSNPAVATAAAAVGSREPHPSGSGGEAPHAAAHGAATPAWRSVFEVFQRHPDHRPKAMSLRRAFHAAGIGAADDAAVAAAAPPPPPSPKHAPPSWLQRAQTRGRSPQDAGAGPSAAAKSSAGGSAAEEAAASPRRGSGGAGAVGSQDGAVVVLMDGSAAEIATAPTAATAITTTTYFTAGTGNSMREHAGRVSEVESAAEPESGDESGSYSSTSSDAYRVGRSAFKPKRTPSGRRRVVPLFLRPCYCGAKYVEPSSQYVKNLIKRRGDRGVGDLDAKHYFWFKRPRFMTSLFTIAYFQNSLSISVCIFALAGMQDAVQTWQGTARWGIVLQLLLDVLLVPQVALSVLPLYALIQPLGSHCPRELLQYAVEAEEQRRHKKERQQPRRSRLSELSTHWRRDKTKKQEGQRPSRSVLGKLSNIFRWGSGSGSKSNSKSDTQAPEPAELAPAASGSPRQRAGRRMGAAGPPVGKAHSYVPPRGSGALSRLESRAGRSTSEVLPGMGSPRSKLRTTLSAGQSSGLRLNGLGSAAGRPASPSRTAAPTGPPQLMGQRAEQQQPQQQVPGVQVVVVQPGQPGASANGGRV